jgi:Protein of unknown function (DUF1493)
VNVDLSETEAVELLLSAKARMLRPSEMLALLVDRAGHSKPNLNYLQAFRCAFNLDLKQASPVMGWQGFDHSYDQIVSNERIDQFLFALIYQSVTVASADIETDEAGRILAVIALIDRTLGVRAKKLSLNTSLYHDLAVAGTDGDEFILEFANSFEVSLDGFDSVEYFGSEAEPLLPWLWARAGGEPVPSPKRLEVIDLVQWARRGYWKD